MTGIVTTDGKYTLVDLKGNRYRFEAQQSEHKGGPDIFVTAEGKEEEYIGFGLDVKGLIRRYLVEQGEPKVDVDALDFGHHF